MIGTHACRYRTTSWQGQCLPCRAHLQLRFLAIHHRLLVAVGLLLAALAALGTAGRTAPLAHAFGAAPGAAPATALAPAAGAGLVVCVLIVAIRIVIITWTCQSRGSIEQCAASRIEGTSSAGGCSSAKPACMSE